ncbi:unnamed protein product [Amaranthus hypochondriacus]
MGRKMYNLVLKAQHHNNARRVVEDLCNKSYEEVQRLLENSMKEQPSPTIVSGAENNGTRPGQNQYLRSVKRGSRVTLRKKKKIHNKKGVQLCNTKETHCIQ